MQTRPFARTARSALILTAALAVLCLLGAIALGVAGQPRNAPTSVDVFDDAEVLDPVVVEEDIADLSFYAPVRVVTWVRDGDPSENLNEEVLGWARDNPELDLLSGDGNYFADGLLLIAVSIYPDSAWDNGDAGTYYGEDVKIAATSEQQRLREKGYADLGAKNWEDGAIAIADAHSGEMARPGWTRPGVVVGIPAVLIALLAANAICVTVLRRRFEANCADFSASTEKVHERVGAAENVLDHGIGSRIRQTAGSVLREYDDTLEIRSWFDALPVWKVTALNPQLWSQQKRFSENNEDIRDASAMLDRATTMYFQDESWESIWDQEVRETREQLESALKDQSIRRAAGQQAAETLTAFSRDALTRLEDVRMRGLRGQGENIVECLDEIVEIRRELTSQMRSIESAALRGSSAQSRHIDREISKDRRVRNRSFRSVTGYYDRSVFYSPRTFTLGYAAGVASHKRAEQAKARASSSSGGSRTGFGSSGGGFRGSGSSSRF